MSYCPPSASRKISETMKRHVQLWRSTPKRRQLVIRAIQLFEIEMLRSEKAAMDHLDVQIGLI